MQTAGLVRAINVNGEALTLDGEPWESGLTASSFTAQGVSFCSQDVPLVPSTDSARAQMIRCSIWQGGSGAAVLRISGVSTGSYQVFLYVWEDNNAETFTVSVNGRQVQTVTSGSAGWWRRLGPWGVEVDGGYIEIRATGGAANLSGLEVRHGVPGASSSSTSAGTSSSSVRSSSSTSYTPVTGDVRVSANKRFLVTADGKPFFYLADTAWELFHRLNREEATAYMDDRAAKGFTVIQAVVLAERDGLTRANPYGHLPLEENDPTRPVEEYFEHVDYIVGLAAARGMSIGMLPTWGDKVGPKAWGSGPEIFTSTNALDYGRFLGARYRNRPIIWILGGDRNPDSEARLDIWRAMAQGLREGDGGAHLITYHPQGGSSSGEFFQDEAWFDFNMRQSGHCDNGDWERIANEYARTPTKPVVDGEPLYEDHPICFNTANGFSDADRIRPFPYRNILAGGFGHTYGHHSIWAMISSGEVNGYWIKTWQEGLEAPGSSQMRHVKALFLSRPFLEMEPDNSVLASSVGSGLDRLQAARGSAGNFAMVHTANGRELVVQMSRIAGRVVAWWFDPRTGQATRIGEYDNTGTRTFTPSSAEDWVLVLDSVAAGFGAPGQP